MSSPKVADSTEETKSDNTDDKEGICRDYNKGRCERKNCKYKHETPDLIFCHDFQNNYCPRPNCKFIHCSPYEEDMYKQDHAMSAQVFAEATRKNQVPGVMQECDNFRKGTCRRNNCKYRHFTGRCFDETHGEVPEYYRNLSKRHDADILCGLKASVHYPFFPEPEPEESECPASKRRLIRVIPMDASTNKPIFRGYHAGTPPDPILNSESNRNGIEAMVYLLQKEVENLKKQVQDLTATNMFLLDQNASIRVSNNHNSAVASSSLTNPTTAPAQQVIGTVTAGVANVPVSISTVPVSLATVPVSLATVSTCNPVTISAMPSVSIASTAQLLAPSSQILVTPSTQLALANNSQAQLTIAASNAQQLAVANVPQQITLTNQGTPQLALASQNQQHLALANQNQQLALANQNQHQQQMLANQNQQQVTLSSQGQQLALANTNQLALSGQSQQILTSQNLAGQQQIELHGTIQTSQPAIVSYPIVTHSIEYSSNR